MDLDDALEARNHFRLFDYMVKTVDEPLSKEMMIQMNMILKRGTSYEDNPAYNVGGFKVRVNGIGMINLFKTTKPADVETELDALLEKFQNKGVLSFEDIVEFHVCFERIHPFGDGNGRMSRLLTTLLLYRSGFSVGKYISLEAKIAKNKDLYYEALGHSQDGWHEGEEDAVPFIKYLLGIILAAYKDFEDRFEIVEEKLPAIEMVRKATQQRIGKFNKQDIRELCPALSVSSIEGSLRKLVAEGELRREGRGKSTFYIRLK